MSTDDKDEWAEALDAQGITEHANRVYTTDFPQCPTMVTINKVTRRCRHFAEICPIHARNPATDR